MKGIILLGVLAFVCVASVQGGERECVANAVFFEDCNWCYCTPEGKKSCTRRVCSTIPDEFKGLTRDLEDDLFKYDDCEPKTTTVRGCNKCFCTYSRKWACTRKLCEPTVLPVAEPLPDAPVPECIPKTRSYDGCNTCFCSESGIWGCTQKLCTTQKISVDNIYVE